jgi:hypothetical protein
VSSALEVLARELDRVTAKRDTLRAKLTKLQRAAAGRRYTARNRERLNADKRAARKAAKS